MAAPSSGTNPRPAWSHRAVAVQVLACLSGVLLAISLVFDAMHGDVAPIISASFFVAFPIVASIVGRRHPENAVVWCFLATALFIGVEQNSVEIGSLGLARHWNGTITHVAAWVDAWSWFPGLFIVVTVGLLRFPDGQLISARWRWLERTALLSIGFFTVCVGVSTWTLSSKVLLGNAEPAETGWRGIVFKAGSSMILVALLLVIASLASLVIRYRRSGLIERQQLRWVLFAALIAIIIEMSLDGIGTFGGHIAPWVQTLGEGIGFALIAITTGIAINRYKLYEIDRIVSRTVSYASVTVLLAGVYFGIVALATYVVPTKYGSVGVAAATLAVAALFVPVRRRVQELVNHRFNRTRYNARVVVEAFAVHVRADLDAQSLNAELLRTVGAAVAPSSVSIWLVPTAAR